MFYTCIRYFTAQIGINIKDLFQLFKCKEIVSWFVFNNTLANDELTSLFRINNTLT